MPRCGGLPRCGGPLQWSYGLPPTSKLARAAAARTSVLCRPMFWREFGEVRSQQPLQGFGLGHAGAAVCFSAGRSVFCLCVSMLWSMAAELWTVCGALLCWSSLSPSLSVCRVKGCLSPSHGVGQRWSCWLWSRNYLREDCVRAAFQQEEGRLTVHAQLHAQAWHWRFMGVQCHRAAGLLRCSAVPLCGASSCAHRCCMPGFGGGCWRQPGNPR